ncbi:hypothetical protein BVG19_g4410 [[Candida] boidinii]|nr:hypothetical protein BVG19_g4410 [[Candida] boidinii]OWB50005.1 hypothetical protein B5S27_g1551 [[Candida] boidinii]
MSNRRLSLNPGSKLPTLSDITNRSSFYKTTNATNSSSGKKIANRTNIPHFSRPQQPPYHNENSITLGNGKRRRLDGEQSNPSSNDGSPSKRDNIDISTTKREAKNDNQFSDFLSLSSSIPHLTENCDSVHKSPSSVLLTSIKREKQLELDEIRSFKNQNREELATFQSDLWRLRTEIPELQLSLEKLNNEYTELQDEYNRKCLDIEEIEKSHELELIKLKNEFDQFVLSSKLDYEKQTEELSQKYAEKAEKIISERNDKFDKEKNEIKRQIESVEDETKQIGLDFENSTSDLNVKFDDMMSARKLEIQEEGKKLEEEVARKKEDLELKELDVKSLMSQYFQKQDELELAEKELQRLEKKLEEEENETEGLRKIAENILNEMNNNERKLNKLQEESESYLNEVERLKQNIEKETKVRRKLNNELQELKGNIRVFCRFRPSKEKLLTKFSREEVSNNEELSESLTLVDPRTESDQDPNLNGKKTKHKFIGLSHRKNEVKKYNFLFDKVFDTAASNYEVYEEISELVQSALDGFNVCIFAYGQTGSGKTYTMSNPEDGMIPMALKQIFDSVEKTKNDHWEFDLDGQFIEIYNENINDLMADSYLKNLDQQKYEIKHDEATMKTSITDVKTIKLTDIRLLEESLQKAYKKRYTASTNANDRSSRSHSVFLVYINGMNTRTGERVNGKLVLVDLAGSERLNHSQATGVRLRETQAINKSLSALADVITALFDKKSHIPYRNSKLTYLLQYSLGGNSKTLMFVNASPLAAHFSETLNSLRFAAKVNRTTMGAIKRN